MKMLVTRIENTNIAGTSKTGKPYHIDNTMIAVSVPFDNSDGFGAKEITYQYGDSTNFVGLKQYQGKLPMLFDIELGATLNQYGGVDTGISSIKPINPVNKAI